MSTRANIKIKDKYSELWFYRHSDGYPSGALPTLRKFLKWLKEGKIRNDPCGAGGWLIMIGAEEYNCTYESRKSTYKRNHPGTAFRPKNVDSGMGWKVGSYEPTTKQHGDIEYLYTVDLDTKTINIKNTCTNESVIDNDDFSPEEIGKLI